MCNSRRNGTTGGLVDCRHIGIIDSRWQSGVSVVAVRCKRLIEMHSWLLFDRSVGRYTHLACISVGRSVGIRV